MNINGYGWQLSDEDEYNRPSRMRDMSGFSTGDEYRRHEIILIKEQRS